VALDVDLTRLVRPPTPASAHDPLLAAAELVVRTSCVGEALTVPMLKLSRHLAGSVEARSAEGWTQLYWRSDEPLRPFTDVGWPRASSSQPAVNFSGCRCDTVRSSRPSFFSLQREFPAG